MSGAALAAHLELPVQGGDARCRRSIGIGCVAIEGHGDSPRFGRCRDD